MNTKEFKDNFKDHFERVKDHFERNKQLYLGLGLGLCVGAGVGAAVMAYKTMSLNAHVRMIAPVSWKPHLENNQVIIQSLERRGHPGTVIRCNETGESFASIRRAADVLNIDRSMLKRHLEGVTPDVNGKTFTALGDAVAKVS